jgi:cobalamin biosynthesis protein CobD/CbiB
MDTAWMVVAGIGMTFILKYSYILRHPRNWVSSLCEATKEFTNCCMCMGFWVGFFLKLCSLLITNGINTLHDVYVCVLLGFIVSITSFFGDILLEVMDAYIDDKKKGSE